jgi:hypothetical protein
MRPFDRSIQPPKGKKLITLKDAAAYIMALPAWNGGRRLRTAQSAQAEAKPVPPPATRKLTPRE